MKNKGKKRIMDINHKAHNFYFCNRCGVLIKEEEWKSDTHKTCNEHFKTKEERKITTGMVLGEINKFFKGGF